MYWAVHMLYCAPQSSVKSWSQAKTNKGVSAPSPAAEFSFQDVTVSEMISKAKQSRCCRCYQSAEAVQGVGSDF